MILIIIWYQFSSLAKEEIEKEAFGKLKEKNVSFRSNELVPPLSLFIIVIENAPESIDSSSTWNLSLLIWQSTTVL